jgi:AcrR family transcriptional regulator
MAATRDPRRQAILDAALGQFMRYGFRRTSMEDIARETGVSRASLYQHFRNKEEIFRSLAERLHEQTLESVEAALKAEGRLSDRVRGALEGKLVRFLDVVAESPHGAELVDESGRLCGDLAAATEERFQRLLGDALRDGARDGEIDLQGAGLSAPAAAELLRLAAHGLKPANADSGLFRRRLQRLVDVFFAGLGA